jgi:hypothetical protein
MKNKYSILFSLLFIFLLSLNTFANIKDGEDILIVLPARSIEKFFSSLLPYEINEYKNFSGSLWIKSITNFKIKNNSLSFSSHIYAKDIIYSLKIGERVSNIELGNVTLFYDLVSTFRLDADKQILYIKPYLKNKVVSKELSDKEYLLDKLFQVFSGIEYPIDLQEINPIMTEFLGKHLTINFEITNIYADHNELTIKLRPIPHIVDENKISGEKMHRTK